MWLTSAIFCFLTVYAVSVSGLDLVITAPDLHPTFCEKTIDDQVKKYNKTNREIYMNEVSPCRYRGSITYHHTNFTGLEKCTVHDAGPCQIGLTTTSFDSIISCPEVTLTTDQIVNVVYSYYFLIIPIHLEGPVRIVLDGLNLRITGEFQNIGSCLCPTPTYSASIDNIYAYDQNNNRMNDYESAVRTILTDSGCTPNSWPEIIQFDQCDSCPSIL